MTMPGDDSWLDGDAGRLVRPYAVTNGRTSASLKFDLMSMVVATGDGFHGNLEHDHLQALALCTRPTSVAEVSARLRLPLGVARVVLGDLVDEGYLALNTRSATGRPDLRLLERVLDGLQAL